MPVGAEGRGKEWADIALVSPSCVRSGHRSVSTKSMSQRFRRLGGQVQHGESP